MIKSDRKPAVYSAGFLIQYDDIRIAVVALTTEQSVGSSRLI